MDPRSYLAALMAESAAQLDAMIAANLSDDQAFFAGEFYKRVAERARLARKELGVQDGEPAEHPEPAGDLEGKPDPEMGQDEVG